MSNRISSPGISSRNFRLTFIRLLTRVSHAVGHIVIMVQSKRKFHLENARLLKRSAGGAELVRATTMQDELDILAVEEIAQMNRTRTRAMKPVKISASSNRSSKALLPLSVYIDYTLRLFYCKDVAFILHRSGSNKLCTACTSFFFSLDLCRRS